MIRSLFLPLLFVAAIGSALAQEPPVRKFPLMLELPSRIDAKEIPEAEEWIEDTAGRVLARSAAALEQGPDALEELARQLQADELKDRDGRCTTHYFFSAITAPKDPVSGERRLPDLQRAITAWRKKHPASLAAMLAEAKLSTELALAAREDGLGIEDIDEKWKVVGACYERSKALLEECRVLEETDPAWAAVWFVMADGYAVARDEFEKVADTFFATFPDGGYGAARAVSYLFTEAHGERGEWESWLRKHCDKIPTGQGAKLYARTFIELANVHWFDDTGVEYMHGVRLDRDLLIKGLDLLAAEFPDSATIASSDAAVSTHVLKDRRRALAAFKRGKGKVDLMSIDDRSSYEWAARFLTSIAWEPKEIGLPDIREIRSGEPAGFTEKMNAAFKSGPAALEKLILDLRSNETLDEDGIQMTTYFFRWFSPTVKNLADERHRVEISRTISEWMDLHPDSPFAKLAMANYWLGYAWDARGERGSAGNIEVKNAGYEKRLKIAEKHLISCREIQDSEPAWTSTAVRILRAMKTETRRNRGNRGGVFRPRSRVRTGARTIPDHAFAGVGW